MTKEIPSIETPVDEIQVLKDKITALEADKKALTDEMAALKKQIRREFATHTLQSFLSNERMWSLAAERANERTSIAAYMAKCAVEYADALVKQLGES